MGNISFADPSWKGLHHLSILRVNVMTFYYQRLSRMTLHRAGESSKMAESSKPLNQDDITKRRRTGVDFAKRKEIEMARKKDAIRFALYLTLTLHLSLIMLTDGSGGELRPKIFPLSL